MLEGPISTGFSNKLNNFDSNNGIPTSKKSYTIYIYIYIYIHGQYIHGQLDKKYYIQLDEALEGPISTRVGII